MKIELEPVPPVYNVARLLWTQLHRSTQKTSVNDKRGIIFETELSISHLMKAAVKANRCVTNAEQRLSFIQEATELIIDIELNVRVMLDLNIIKEKGFAQIVRIEDDIRGQLYSWARSTAPVC